MRQLFTTADAILDGLKARRARIAAPAYDGHKLNDVGLALLTQLDAIIARIETDLRHELDQMAFFYSNDEHIDSDPTPALGIDRPAAEECAWNTCTRCGHGGAPWLSYLSEFVHLRCLQCSASFELPNPHGTPYPKQCVLEDGHHGPHKYNAGGQLSGLPHWVEFPSATQ